MSYKFRFKQKSLYGRFLFILGLAAFLACVALGLMFIFDENMLANFNFTHGARLTIGFLILIYGILRFVRLFRTEPDDE
jgi:branched-subunit amino acid ABC-type transport system permease component